MVEDSEFMTAFHGLPVEPGSKAAAFRVGKHWRYPKLSIRVWDDHPEQKVAAKDLSA